MSAFYQQQSFDTASSASAGSFSHNPYVFPVLEHADYNPYGQLPQCQGIAPARYPQYPVEQQCYNVNYNNQQNEAASLQYYQQQSYNQQPQYSQYPAPAPTAAAKHDYEAYAPEAYSARAHQPYTNLPPAAAACGYDIQKPQQATAPSPIAIPAPRSKAPQVTVVPRIRRSASIISNNSNGTDEISSHSSEPADTPKTQTPTNETQQDEGPYHKPLLGRCQFVVPPPAPKYDGKNQPQYSTTAYPVFLGQIRLEVKPAALRVTIEALCGVRPSKIESRGTGCFLAYLHKKEDIATVRALNRRVLFDKAGLWYARSDEEAASMANYVAEVVSKAPRGFRLPKDAMVVAEEKSL